MVTMRYLLLRPLPFVLPIATGWWFGQTCEPWPAVLGCVAIAALVAAVGLLLLSRTRVGELSWRNRLGGLLLPWGYRFGGRLTTIVPVSWLVWSLLAVATVLCTRPPDPVGAAPGAAPEVAGLSYLLLLAWVADGGLLLYTLGHRSASRSLRRFQWSLGALIAVSVVLLCSGHSVLATLLAGGPILLLGLWFGGYTGLMLLSGKHTRWN